jgi:hypothetical protein
MAICNCGTCADCKKAAKKLVNLVGGFFSEAERLITQLADLPCFSETALVIIETSTAMCSAIQFTDLIHTIQNAGEGLQCLLLDPQKRKMLTGLIGTGLFMLSLNEPYQNAKDTNNTVEDLLEKGKLSRPIHEWHEKLYCKNSSCRCRTILTNFFERKPGYKLASYIYLYSGIIFGRIVPSALSIINAVLHGKSITKNVNCYFPSSAIDAVWPGFFALLGLPQKVMFHITSIPKWARNFYVHLLMNITYSGLTLLPLCLSKFTQIQAKWPEPERYHTTSNALISDAIYNAFLVAGCLWWSIRFQHKRNLLKIDKADKIHDGTINDDETKSLINSTSIKHTWRSNGERLVDSFGVAAKAILSAEGLLYFFDTSEKYGPAVEPEISATLNYIIMALFVVLFLVIYVPGRSMQMYKL